MRKIIITTSENLYLPVFFKRLFEERSDFEKIFVTNIKKKKEKNSLSVLLRYLKTFGWKNTVILIWKYIKIEILDTFRNVKIASIFKSKKINYEIIENVNDVDFVDQIKSLNIDLIISVSCPQIFGLRLISVPKIGCINIHGSELPKYRGLLPSFWTLLNQENDGCVTLFFIKDEKLDLGDAVCVKKFKIPANISLHEFLIYSKKIHATSLLNTLESIESGSFSRTPIIDSKGSYCAFPTRDDYLDFVGKGLRVW
jgi:methionyl-tRNA formyltransferase